AQKHKRTASERTARSSLAERAAARQGLESASSERMASAAAPREAPHGGCVEALRRALEVARGEVAGLVSVEALGQEGDRHRGRSAPVHRLAQEGVGGL